MAASLVNRISIALGRFEQYVGILFGRRFPPESLCFAGAEINTRIIKQGAPVPVSLKDIIQDGILWAVPKSRRTIERRLKRKFGNPEYVLKVLQPKTTLRTCNVCGDDHEVGVLCPTCYKKVINETKEMQQTIENELKLKPVDKEIIVLYEGESNDQSEFCQGKRIVEMKKPRPSWFSKNLLQKSTQVPATTKDIKPSDLS